MLTAVAPAPHPDYLASELTATSRGSHIFLTKVEVLQKIRGWSSDSNLHPGFFPLPPPARCSLRVLRIMRHCIITYAPLNAREEHNFLGDALCSLRQTCGYAGGWSMWEQQNTD